MPRGENSERRHEHEHTPLNVPAAERFAIALFARYDRPAVDQQTIGPDELVAMLTTFVEIADKRQARCWSPTLYAFSRRYSALGKPFAWRFTRQDLQRRLTDPLLNDQPHLITPLASAA